MLGRGWFAVNTVLPEDLIAKPLVVETWGAAVVLLGPRGVNLAMTADAAEESARRLDEAVRRSRKENAADG